MDAYIAKTKAVKSMKEISKIMDDLGVSDEGLETLDEMKDKVIDKIKKSQEEAKWSPGQVSVILWILECLMIYLLEAIKDVSLYNL